MPLRPPIFLAYGDSSPWDAVIWLVAGIFWLFIQMANARKQKARKDLKSRSAGAPAAAADDGDAPKPDELVEIFRRLGANIPRTPPPAPPPGPRPTAAPSRPAVRLQRKPAAAVAPELARRLERAKREAAEAARQAEAELRAAQAPPAEAPNIQIHSDDHRALADATRQAGTILPRMHAMCVPLSPLPILPMPGGDRSHHPGAPLRAKLRDRKEVRDALVAQTFLQPAKGLAL